MVKPFFLILLQGVAAFLLYFVLFSIYYIVYNNLIVSRKSRITSATYFSGPVDENGNPVEETAGALGVVFFHDYMQRLKEHMFNIIYYIYI